MVKKPPCHAGDVSWIPGQGAKTPHAVKQRSPCSTATEPELRSQGITTTEARTPGASAPHERDHGNEKPHIPAREYPLLGGTRESPRTATKAQHGQK